MKTKGKPPVIQNGHRFSLPAVLVFCFMSFLGGFYVSIPFTPQNVNQGQRIAAGRKNLETVDMKDLNVFTHGESGDNYISDIPFQVLSWYPRALLFPNFASKEQCETIIKLAKKHLSPSDVAIRIGETAEMHKGTRTSSGTFLISRQDKTGTLGWVEQKMARATMTPVSNGEAFNVLRYEIGQKYDSHYDFFNPTEYGPQKSQRMASFLLYLSDVEQGGETMFPYEGGRNMDINYDYKECIGLKVKPKQGDALLFYSMFHNGTFDVTSLHGSCPVVKGEKWVATKWIRDQDSW